MRGGCRRAGRVVCRAGHEQVAREQVAMVEGPRYGALLQETCSRPDRFDRALELGVLRLGDVAWVRRFGSGHRGGHP